MDIKMIQEKLSEAIKTPEDNDKYQAFVSEYVNLLKEVHINDITASLAVEAVELDQGANVLDAFCSMEKEEARKAWKVIEGCAAFKDNARCNALKLTCYFVACAMGGDVNTSAVFGHTLEAIVNTSMRPGGKKVNKEAYTVIEKSFLQVLPDKLKLPAWKDVMIAEEKTKAFCEIMQNSLNQDSAKEARLNNPAVRTINRWIIDGNQYVKEALATKEKEKNKLKRRSPEIDNFIRRLEDFKKYTSTLEDKIDQATEENTKLDQKVKELQAKLTQEELLTKEKDQTIRNLQSEIKDLKSKIEQAENEIGERKKLNDAQVQYREEAQVSLLQDISRALKPEYEDFAETKDIQKVDEMLGEIYREKLKKVFKILEQKGIKVAE